MFKTAMTRLYFYSFTANYEDQIALGKTPKLKIGETTQGSAAVRIQQQMGTATAEKPTIYGEFNVPFTDKQFHAFLRSRGYSQTDGAGTEWFLISAPEAEALVHEFAAICKGVATPIRQSLTSRPYQTAFVNKFLNTAERFCLFAKCRSGKSVMGILAAQEAGYTSMVVVSYRTSAANSWRNDAATYTVFHEWDVIDLSESGWERKIAASQKANRKQLMVSTVQRQSERFGYLSGLRAHYPDGIDLLTLDECHIGGESDQFKKLLEGLPHRRLLEISGTAYKSIWKYDASNVFVWGYVEEQRAKAEGADWAQSLPRMELVFARYDAGAKANVYGDDPDALKNVFSIENGKWKDSASVQAFLRQFFAYGAMCRKQEQLLHKSQHIVMSLPSVEACYHFAESLKEFGSQFVPLVITGDSGNDQDAILEHVRSNPATICLTRWANVVGVTVPEWDTVIHGCEYQSAEFWVQFAFRGGSTRRDSWRVIDFAPERAVSSIVEMASVTASVEGNEQPDNVLRAFVDFADVFAFNNGFTELDYANLLQFGNVGTTSVKAAINAAVGAVCVGGNLRALAWAFEGLDKLQDKEMLREMLTENGTDSASNARNAPARAEIDKEKKLLKETLARVKAAVGKLDDVVLHAMLRGVHVSTLPQVLAYSEFESLTGCHPDLFDQAIMDGWINLRVTSNSVTQAHTMLDARLRAVEKAHTITQRVHGFYDTTTEVFDWHKSSECVTPLGLAQKQFDGCNVDGTVCIPGAGIGTYVLAAIEAGFQPANICAVEFDKGYYQLGAAIFDRFGINYVHADFLTWEPQMKFDVVIGNPPYQDSSTESRDKKLWTKFVWKSLELLQDGGTLSFVTPNSLVGRTRLPAQMRKVLSTDYSLDWLDHTANKFFPNVGVDICSWSVSKRTYTGETNVIDPDSKRIVDIREELPIPSALKVSDDLAEKINGQIGVDGVPELKRDYNDVDQTPHEDGKYLNYVSGRNKRFRTNDVCKNTGKLKVVFSFSATYKQWFVTDANISGTNVYVCVDSVEEGLEIGNTLMHPLMMFYIDNWRRTAGFCPAIKNNGALPDIRGLGEEEVYKKFNLTEDEIAYIKSGYSEYKSLDRVLMQ